MKRNTRALVLVASITLALLLSAGCGSNSANGTYYRDFGNYISTTMYIELKKDKTYETDGSSSILRMEGTYEINGDVITFTQDLHFSDGKQTLSGTINGKTLTIDGVKYIK